LRQEGYEVFTAANGKEGIEQGIKCLPHLIILDVMMPGMDGIETCERLRTMPNLNNPLIVFLTARFEDYSQIAGFKAGADDYLSKPIKIKVLINRVNALLKRYHGNIADNNFIGSMEIEPDREGLVIDKEKYVVINRGIEMILPKKEFKLLLLLSSKPEKVFTRENIFNHVWGDDVVVGGRTIDVHIRKLREKIGTERIVTIKGVGYKFKS
jgi:two-component system alkaline phosphatase synthesis response regulator PhoP